MRKFERELITEWRNLRLPVSEAAVVVAVSGGADSVSLLLAVSELVRLKKLDVRIIAAHFNHNLRGEESSKDEEFIKTLTAAKGIELVTERAGSLIKGNLEQEARNARYVFLQETAERLNAHAVLAAHTLNDQAETFLINLIRGSGVSGLGAMKAVRPLARNSSNDDRPEVILARPLLHWATRGDTENYCHQNDVVFRYDSMNEDLSFTRVRIRKLLIPMLQEFNPKIIEILSQTAGLIQIAEEFHEPAIPAGSKADFLDLKYLKNLNKAELYRTIREWLRHHRGDFRQLGLKQIEAVENLIFSRKSGKIVEIAGGRAVVKRGGKLFFEDLKVEK